MRIGAPFFALALVAMASAGCGDDDGPAGACTPGESVACVGAGGCSGGQVCLPDGTGFGPCDCGGGMDAGGGDADAGGGGDDAGTTTDGATGTDAATDAALPDPDDCDPVENTGCDADEKCSWKLESLDPIAGRTTCVPEGTAEVDESCTREDVDSGGYDDCVGGSWCNAGVCTPICHETDAVCAEGVCQDYMGVFDDREGVGACIPTCNLITQDCDGAEGCYLSLTTGSATCSATASGAETKMQGDDCDLINDCPVGYGCHLNDDPVSPTGLVCAYYCDAAGSGGPSCTDTEGPGAGFGCISLQDLYSGLPASIPDAVGICVPCADYPSAPGCS